jgi:cell division initiation protein
MALTPVEIRHLTPPRTFFRGYRVAPTDKLLEEIAASFEDVWRERADLADKVEQLENDLVRFRELEGLLRTTLVSAEQASAKTKEQARREAELILAEATAHAREIQRCAIAENERLAHESRRLRAQLVDALAALPEPEAASTPEPSPEPEAATAPEPSPERNAKDEAPGADKESGWHIPVPGGSGILPNLDAA